MTTFRQRILEASNQPQGSSLRLHLQNLQDIKYTPIKDTVELVEGSNLLSLKEVEPITLNIVATPSNNLEVIKDRQSNLNIGVDKIGIEVS